ncbi:hypothetical protein LCGC14_2819760 [marine sediment metagenome]|uniref:Uncharacterized protein n=1 Tax=marine sediment metagenome TaxID=412755 RepID=A0A0F9B8K0_9ZZZZ
MFVHTGEVPDNSIRYYNEVMSGFEYAAAASMLQYGMIEEGLGMVKAISERYDGRVIIDRGPGHKRWGMARQFDWSYKFRGGIVVWVS